MTAPRRVWVSKDGGMLESLWIWTVKPKYIKRDKCFIYAEANRPDQYAENGHSADFLEKMLGPFKIGECREFILKSVTGKKGRKSK